MDQAPADAGAFSLPGELQTISALTPDLRNANRHTQRGTALLEDSLRKHGAGRSILVDRNNKVIAGNSTLESYASIGMEDIQIVESDGRRLVVVKRTDVDLETPEGRSLALADNRTNEVGLEWDADVLKGLQDEGVDLTGLWFDNELAMLIGDIETPDDPREHWNGMNSGMPDEPMACRAVTVYFKRHVDVEAFFALLDQSYSDKTKSVWYPPKKDE